MIMYVREVDTITMTLNSARELCALLFSGVGTAADMCGEMLR